MKLFFRVFIVLPVALVLLLFSIANRHLVTVSFDPFPGNDIDGPALTAPLFLMLMLAGVAGLFAGGFAVWLRQRLWRREARLARMDARNAQGEADRLRADLLEMRAQPRSATGTALVPVARSNAA